MILTSHQVPRRDLALLWHQIRYEQLSFWRNPQSAFFTFAFPVVIIAIFGVLLHGASGSSYFYGLSALQYYVPTIAALSVLGSCYSQLAIVLAMRRQDGTLKRVRATPLPAWTYFLGLLAHCIMVSAVDVVLITGIGAAFGTPMPTHWPAIALALILGAASFCALRVAVASLIRNAEAAPAVVQLVLFPLVFISGSYMPIHSDMLNRISGALPVRPFNLALMGPFAQHSGFDWKDLGVLLAWGAAGALIAVRRFRWDPRPEQPRPPYRRYPMRPHLPPCPAADRPDRGAARTVAFHPEQGWSLLCNGVIVFEDLGEILPDGRVVPSHRQTRSRLPAAA